MSYTLDEFAADIRSSLKEDAGAAGIEAVRVLTEKAVSDPKFVQEFLGPQNTKKRSVLYEDPELGFCICTHVGEGKDEKGPPPHNHGTTWAIYGQAVGTTTMTDWKILEPAEDDRPGLVEPIETYDLTPGKARAYDVGFVHSPTRGGATRFLRIEGENLDHVAGRATYKPAGA